MASGISGWRRVALSLAFCLSRQSSPPAQAMVRAGKAWEKPGVNEQHRAAVVAAARAAQARRGPPDDPFEAGLCAIVDASPLGDARKANAHQNIRCACEHLRAGKNPLHGLKPPETCKSCKIGKHHLHDFLCLRRERQPGPEELKVRSKLLRDLNDEYRRTLDARLPVRACTHALHPRCRMPARVTSARTCVVRCLR